MVACWAPKRLGWRPFPAVKCTGLPDPFGQRLEQRHLDRGAFAGDFPRDTARPASPLKAYMPVAMSAIDTPTLATRRACRSPRPARPRTGPAGRRPCGRPTGHRCPIRRSRATILRGSRARRSAARRPSRAAAPGLRFCTTTSARSASSCRIARPCGRLHVQLDGFLPG